MVEGEQILVLKDVVETAEEGAHTDTHTEVSLLDRIRMLRDMSIYERIDMAYAEISQSQFTKDGTVRVSGAAGYRFISIGQILEPVRKAHGKWGVKVFFGVPEYCIERGEKRYAQPRGNSTWQVANGHIHVRIVGRDEDDCIEMDVPFEAQDNSDKLTNKILTNAERCLYRTLYAIDEGDASDPEAINEPVREEPAPMRVRAREVKDDPFFSKKPKDESKAVAEAEASAVTAKDMVFNDALPTAKDMAEATYGPSTVSDKTLMIARPLARRWMDAHKSDDYVKSQIKRFGGDDLREWPRAHVVDMANLQLEAEGRDLLTYGLEGQ